MGEWLSYAPMVLAVPCVLLTLLALLSLAIYLLLFVARREVRLRKQARHDYRAARGTQHRQQLRASLSSLRNSQRARRARIGDLEKQLNRLRQNRSAELKAALSRYLVTSRLTDVPGIGQRLSQRIVQHCFRGSLRDLRTASRVRGVGPSRQRAINAWVHDMESRFPRLLAGRFPSKQRIFGKYAEQERSLQAALGAEQRKLESENRLCDQAQAVASRLGKVKASHFRKALRRNQSASPVPAWYFVGAYPPWESMPEWFEAMLREYGG